MRLVSERTQAPILTTPPTWDDYWATVGNETYLVARDLIEISPTIQRHFEHHLIWRDTTPGPDGWRWRSAKLDWPAAARAADQWPCSTTEAILLDLILGLIQPDEDTQFEDRWDPETSESFEVRVTTGTRVINPLHLGRLGPWSGQVADILHRWMTT